MDWLTEIIKQLQTSRAFVTAVFVACLSVLLGHAFAPSLIPEVPDDWKLPLIGGLIFSGTLLAFIIIPFFWSYFSKILNNKSQKTRSLNLSSNEQGFLYIMALIIEDSGEDFINLSNLNYDAMEISRLETQEVASSLVNKGLIKTNPFESTLVSFTITGRSKAIEIKNSAAQARRLS
tara:strand:+ start:350 stop:880 length:531 start_codon:yes stop_codon:yes gene_type:complete